MKKEGIVVKNYLDKLSGKQLFKYVWKIKNSDERKAAREYAVQRGYAIRCDIIASAFDHILTVPDEGELADRLTGGRSSRPSRASGIPAKAAGALLAVAAAGSQVSAAAGSTLWIASLPAVPVLTYLSWLATLRLAWDVTTTVSDEAVETVN